VSRFAWPTGAPTIVGVLNVTADSFSDGGRYLDPSAAIERGIALHSEGAGLVDVGGESTRPGARPVPADEELARVIPVVAGLVKAGVPVCVDTMKPEVMRAAIEAGCSAVNDVNAFRAPGSVEAVPGSGVGVVAMHMQGTPQTMQVAPRYEDVVAEVAAFLLERARGLESGGIAKELIVLDPGFGFGKTIEHNRALFRGLPSLCALGYRVLVGVSRKRMIGELTGRDVGSRAVGSVAAALFAVQQGASLVRVHDVRDTSDALKVWMALRPP
jgi:dihydropteroate synthase